MLPTLPRAAPRTAGPRRSSWPARSVPPRRWLYATVLVLLAAMGPAAVKASVREPVVSQARRDVAAAVPGGDPLLEHVTVLRLSDDRILVCFTLAFHAPVPGRRRAALLYARDGGGRLSPMGPPLFHGPDGPRGSWPVPAACAAVEAGR